VRFCNLIHRYIKQREDRAGYFQLVLIPMSLAEKIFSIKLRVK